MNWKANKDGATVTFKKDYLTVLWSLDERKYEVRRTEGDTERVVEQGRAAHLPIESFLQYVEMTWGNW